MSNVIDLEQKRNERTPGYTQCLSFEGRPGECSCADFVLGVEAGMLYARLQAKPMHWGGTYHAANVLMIERIAKAVGYLVKITRSESPAWVFADFVPEDGPAVLL